MSNSGRSELGKSTAYQSLATGFLATGLHECSDIRCCGGVSWQIPLFLAAVAAAVYLPRQFDTPTVTNTCLLNITEISDEPHVQFDGLAFIHVPKCGGTSLRSYFATLAKSFGYRAYIEETPTWWSLAKSNATSRIDVYGGSSHLGYKDLLSSWPEGRVEKAAFFTQLRHPMERLASHYEYVKQFPEHKLFREAKTKSLKDFASNVTDGYMLSFFFSHNVTEVDGHELHRCCFDRTDLEEAKALLSEKFAAVGVVGKQSMTEAVLWCRIPWIRKAMLRMKGGTLKIPHLNPTQHGGVRFDDDVTREKFPLDYELYEFALELLSKDYAECKDSGHLPIDSAVMCE